MVKNTGGWYTTRKSKTMILGITGHQYLQDPTKWVWVEKEMRTIISKKKDLVGVTSLAVGADSLFADLVLEYGGKLYVIIPFIDYALEFKESKDLIKYNKLLQQSHKIDVQESKKSKEDAYYSAGKQVVDISQEIITVWDGRPAAGLGGTGDIVKYAELQDKSIYHINPETEITKYIQNLHGSAA